MRLLPPPSDRSPARLGMKRRSQSLCAFQSAPECPAKLHAPGIYNRAMLFAGTRSPSLMASRRSSQTCATDEAAVRDTALGAWLRAPISAPAPPPPIDDRPILEVLPLNTEQRQAVVQGLSAPLTVVTGPPGTGKSQVVTSLLANRHGTAAARCFPAGTTMPWMSWNRASMGWGLLPCCCARQGGSSRASCATSDGDSGGFGERGRIDWLRVVSRNARKDARAIGRCRTNRRGGSFAQWADELERAAEPASSLFSATRGFRSLDGDGIRRSRACRILRGPRSAGDSAHPPWSACCVNR